jgi:CheY-like chemotaxis protein
MSGESERDGPAAGQPAVTPGAGAKSAPPSEKLGSAGRPARILIVEDEPWDAELAQRLLRDAEVSVTAIVVDAEASFVAQLAAFHPDVILSDYHLPGFSGRKALAIAQERCAHVPFIIWSGVLGDEAAVELIKLGATDYVLKDRPARLPSVIQQAIAQAEQRARLDGLEDQLRNAQHLASLGQLAAAKEAVQLTRRLLADARQDVTPADLQP